jgi:chorismate mutase/prephenate dehydratase
MYHMTDADISQLRQDVDRIDHALIELLAQRRRVSVDMAHAKRSAGRTFHDQEREQTLSAERLRAAKKLDLDSSLVARLWREIIDDSLRLQHEYLQHELNTGAESLIAAFQGVEGAYSHLAGQEFFESKPVEVSWLECTQFRDVVAAVEDGRADIGVLPTENTTSGAISEVYDLLMHSRLAVVGETKFRVRHCLLGLEATDPSAIRTVFAHPQAVLQCSEFLTELDDVQIVYFGDTALSGRRIRELADPATAAIASEEAARLFDLTVLRRDIANYEENHTRFLFTARTPITVDPQIPTKTSLVMAVGNQPGALLDALVCFRDEGINLVKLESRPIPRNPGEELFYVDFEGNQSDSRVERALRALAETARFVRVLGSYPSRDLRPRVELPSG